MAAILRFALLLVAVAVLVFASYRLYCYNSERTKDERLTKQVVSENADKQTAPISVDFEKLLQENGDIIAWLYCEDTPINYPIAQAEDNSYYLNKKTDGSYSASGTLFADCKNSADFTDDNTIIYGHNMKNNTMFGTLTRYGEQEYFDKHPKMYLLTPDREYVLELVAGATVNSTSSVYTLPAADKQKLVSDLMGRSTFKTDYKYSPQDKFVTLSTCSYVNDEARYVLAGVLREI